MTDLRTALAYLADHAADPPFDGLDMSRVFIWGESAGAITSGTVTFAGETRATVAAAVGISGCIWPFMLNASGPAPPRSARNGSEELVPWLDVHGDADLRVFPFLAYMTYNLLRALGLQASSNELVIVPGGGHVPWAPKTRDLIRPFIQAFVVKHLELEAHACANATVGSGAT